MSLQQNNISSSVNLQAKLANELMKILETYKIPELNFDTKAKVRQSNCKAPKKVRKQQANTAQENQGNEIACLAFDIMMSDNKSTTSIMGDNHDATTQNATNMFFINDNDLHFYLLNYFLSQCILRPSNSF